MNQIEFDQVMADLFKPQKKNISDAFDEIFDKQIEALEAHCESEDDNEEILRPLVKEDNPKFDPISSKDNNIFSSQSSENKNESDFETIQNEENNDNSNAAGPKKLNLTGTKNFVPDTELENEENEPPAEIIDELNNLLNKKISPEKSQTIPEKTFESLKIKKKPQKRSRQAAKKLTSEQMTNLRPVFQKMTEMVFEPIFKKMVNNTLEKLMECHKDDTGQVY